MGGMAAWQPWAPAGALATAGDVQLRCGLQRRDPAALGEAMRRHGSSVAAVAYFVMGQPASVDDVVQDVFVQLWARPERYDPGRGGLGTFLRVDARCRALDLVRRDSSRRLRERAGPTDTGGDPAQLVADRPDTEALRRALDALSGGERAAIELAFFAGHSYCEVARILELPEGTVKGRIRSGLARLRSNLADPTTRRPAEDPIVAGREANTGFSAMSGPITAFGPIAAPD